MAAAVILSSNGAIEDDPAFSNYQDSFSSLSDQEVGEMLRACIADQNYSLISGIMTAGLIILNPEVILAIGVNARGLVEMNKETMSALFSVGSNASQIIVCFENVVGTNEEAEEWQEERMGRL